jgi:beta-lactam-binding protein with PASTA domain
MVEMPNLVGFSIRNAEMYLENLGLHLGETSFRPDIAKNAVLEQLYNGQPIATGTKIFMGSTISFVLGNGVGDELISVPDLMGKQYKSVKSLLRGLNINFTPVFDSDVIDSASAYVYRQNPTKYGKSNSGEKKYNSIKPGQSMDIWFSVSAPVRDTLAIAPADALSP